MEGNLQSHRKNGSAPRKIYSGSKLFENKIFGDYYSHSIALRDGFINCFVPSLLQDRDVAILNSIPAYIYVDGEFWYDAFVCEKYNTTLFSEHYGLNPDNISFIKVSWWSRMSAEERSLYEAEVTKTLNTHDFSKTEDYDDFCQSFDVQSFIDYTCINIYIDNEDTQDKLNSLLWKAIIKEDNGYGDGRWRWGLYDLDLGWGSLRRKQGVEENYEVNTFAYGRDNRTPLNEQPIYAALRRNGTFCKQFILTFMDLVNTDFLPEVVLQKLDEWGNTNSAYTKFFTYRPEYIVPYMAEEFGLTGTLETVTVSSSQAGHNITLNTITPQLNSNLSWSGNYYTDYPITVTTSDKYFDHWEISSNSGGQVEKYYDPTIEVEVKEGGVQIHAVFK